MNGLTALIHSDYYILAKFVIPLAFTDVTVDIGEQVYRYTLILLRHFFRDFFNIIGYWEIGREIRRERGERRGENKNLCE